MFYENEHDYAKMLNFMRKSLKFFKIGNPHITKPFIDNIDFIIINFPYFLDIDMVADYLLTDNQEFNYAFYSKIRLFLNIINYNNTDIKSTSVNNKIIDNLTARRGLRNFYTVDINQHNNIYNQNTSKSIDFDYLNIECINNKLNLWNNALGRSTKEKLYKWLNNDPNISTLNHQDIVLKLFFEILLYHFDHIKIFLKDTTAIENFLDKLDINDIIIKKIFEYDKSIFNSIPNLINILLNNNKLDFLEEITSYNIYFVKKENFNKIMYRFLSSTEYLDYKILYDIICKLIKCYKIKIPVYNNLISENGKFTVKDIKRKLYLSLICYNCDMIMDEIFEISLHLYLIDLFFSDMQFFHLCIFNFIRGLIIKNKINLVKILDKKYKDGINQFYNKKPNLENVFSYVILFYKCRFRRLEQLCYKDIDLINKFLDEYYDESFVRYICKLVIDEIPVLNILED